MCHVGIEKSSLMKIKWTGIGLAINCGSEEHQSQHGHSKHCKWYIQQILQTKRVQLVWGSPLSKSQTSPTRTHRTHLLRPR